MSPSVPVWRSRGVLVRPEVGCTTDPASPARPINRGGARSGVGTIRPCQLQAVVVLAGGATSLRPARGARRRPREGLLMDGNEERLETQDKIGPFLRGDGGNTSEVWLGVAEGVAIRF